MMKQLFATGPGTCLSRLVLVAVVLLLPLCSPRPASAQGFALSGSILDEADESPLQYAVVGLPELELWDLTDETGEFILEGVQPGVFRFLVLRRGFYMAIEDLEIDGPADIIVDLTAEDRDTPLGPGNLMGVVLDQTSGSPVDGAEIRIEPTGQEARTDAQGRFEITDISSGALELQFRRIGYEPRVDTLAAFPGVTFELNITMSAQAITLDPIEVTVRPRFLESAGFYRRQRRGGGGRFFTRSDIEQRARASLRPLFLTIPGIEVGRGHMGQTALLSRRGGGCELTVYVDGTRMRGIDIETFPPDAIEAMEVFVGLGIPAQFHDDCGVLLIWTAR